MWSKFVPVTISFDSLQSSWIGFHAYKNLRDEGWRQIKEPDQVAVQNQA